MKPSKLLHMYAARQRLSARTLFITALVMLIAAMPSSADAQGNLLVTPRRILFENAVRVQELNLANIGEDSAKYLVSIIEIRMKEDGSFEQITIPDSGQLFASSHLRIYPRNVTIAPGGSQLVKVQLARTEEMIPGEYRSHIYIRAVPVEKPLGNKEEVHDPNDISVKLTAIFGISIPAIIRIGEDDTKVSLTNPAFVMVDKTPKLNITLNRTGKMSSYGDMTVECIAPNGKVTEVGSVKGIAVYTPNSKRNFQIELDKTQKVDYKACKLHIVYKTQKDARTQDESEAELAL